MTRHFGVFQFKEGVTDAEIEECFAEMRAMVGISPGLLSMESGPYQSTEGLDDGYTHGFIMTFDSAQSRDAYLPHPEHLKRVELVQPRLERLVVFDFDVTAESSAQL